MVQRLQHTLYQVSTALIECWSGNESNFKREYRLKAPFRFFATVAIALTMGPAFFGQQRSVSNIHARISSIPTGANVKVDGADVGTTPLEIELPCCFHDVTISKRGFEPWTARVRNNGHANVTAHLKRREISQAIHADSM